MTFLHAHGEKIYSIDGLLHDEYTSFLKREELTANFSI